MLRRLACALVFVGTASSIVYADGMPERYRAYDQPTWTGLYLGGHIGAAWGHMNATDLNGLDSLIRPLSFSLNDTALIVGGQVGYNMQVSNLVFGVEVDVGGIRFGKTKFEPNDPFFDTFVGLQSGLYGDVTGRVGYAFGRSLLYGKGGFAFYNGRAFVDNTNGAVGLRVRETTDTFTGWTVGGGLEHQLGAAWSLKVEYQHFDFGTEDAVLHSKNLGDFRYPFSLSSDAVTVGFNYRFGSRYEPLK